MTISTGGRWRADELLGMRGRANATSDSGLKASCGRVNTDLFLRPAWTKRLRSPARRGFLDVQQT